MLVEELRSGASEKRVEVARLLLLLLGKALKIEHGFIEWVIEMIKSIAASGRRRGHCTKARNHAIWYEVAVIRAAIVERFETVAGMVLLEEVLLLLK